MSFCRCGKAGPLEWDGVCRICWARVWFPHALPPEPKPKEAKKPTVNRSKEPCRHKGAEVRRVGCGTCRGKVEKKVFACELHGECGLGVPGVRSCLECGDYETEQRWPIRFDHRNLAPGRRGFRFNSSIVSWEGGGYLIAYRDGWSQSNIWTVPLDRQFRPCGEAVQAHTSISGASYGREDPRLFWFRGQLHLAFIGVQGRTRIVRTNQCFARLGPDRTVDDAWTVELPGRRAWEKNWSLFEHADELYAVYLTHPFHMVVRIRSATAEVVHREPNFLPWSGGELRGGAPPVLVGDEFWSFTHDRVDLNGVGTYRMHLYSFDAKPPFAPRRIVREPLLVADLKTKPSGVACCVFPCGAVRTGDDWIVSMGIHDRWTEIHKFAHADLDRRLEPVEVPKVPAEVKLPPEMVSVTIGVGEKFRPLAEASAARVREFYGVRHSIVLDERHLEACPPQHLFRDFPRRVFWLKWMVPLFFPNVERWLYHDADVTVLRDPGPETRRVLNTDPRLIGVEDWWPERPPGYLNAGFTVFNRAHLDLLDWCRTNYWKVPEVFGDQCVLNYAIKKLGISCLALPREYNVGKPNQHPDPVAVHGYWWKPTDERMFVPEVRQEE